jgi:hypothetical protein
MDTVFVKFKETGKWAHADPRKGSYIIEKIGQVMELDEATAKIVLDVERDLAEIVDPPESESKPELEEEEEAAEEPVRPLRRGRGRGRRGRADPLE